MKKSRVLFPMKTYSQGHTDDLCGVKCLESIYDYYGNIKSTNTLVRDLALADELTYIPQLLRLLARDGFSVLAVSSNPYVFDLTWKNLSNKEIIAKLHSRYHYINNSKWKRSIVEYILYLEESNSITQTIISESYIKGQLFDDKLVLAFTDNVVYHQRGRRYWDENNKTYEPDDIRGGSDGHAVVVNGWDPKRGFHIVDPSLIQSYGSDGQYWIDPAILIAGIYTLSGEVGVIWKR